MLQLFRKHVIEDALDAHITKFLDTDAETERLPKRLLTSSFLMAPIVAFPRGKMDTSF